MVKLQLTVWSFWISTSTACSVLTAPSHDAWRAALAAFGTRATRIGGSCKWNCEAMRDVQLVWWLLVATGARGSWNWAGENGVCPLGHNCCRSSSRIRTDVRLQSVATVFTSLAPSVSFRCVCFAYRRNHSSRRLRLFRTSSIFHAVTARSHDASKWEKASFFTDYDIRGF